MLKIWGEREPMISIDISLIWLSYFCIYFLWIFMVRAITLVLESRKTETPLVIWLLKLVFRCISTCYLQNNMVHL